MIDWAWLADHLDDLAFRTIQHLVLAAIAVAIGFADLVRAGALVGPPSRRLRPDHRADRHRVHDPEPRDVRRCSCRSPASRIVTAEIPLDRLHAADLRPQHRRGLRHRPARRPRGSRRHGLSAGIAGSGGSSCRSPIPLIVAGVRLATVSTIGLVTITGILGDRFGGLGFFIFEGYRHSSRPRS